MKITSDNARQILMEYDLHLIPGTELWHLGAYLLIRAWCQQNGMQSQSGASGIEEVIAFLESLAGRKTGER